MPEATKYNLYIENYRGANTEAVFTFQLELLDNDDHPYPGLDGAFSTFTIKKTYRDEVPLVQVSSPTSIQIDANTSNIAITLLVSDIANIPTNVEEQTYFYDWDLVTSEGRFFRLLKGEVVFGGDI